MNAEGRTPKIDDKTIRKLSQQRGWWYASSRDYGPAHIVNNRQLTLCGSYYDTRYRVQATKLCGHCRQIASAILEPTIVSKTLAKESATENR